MTFGYLLTNVSTIAMFTNTHTTYLYVCVCMYILIGNSYEWARHLKAAVKLNVKITAQVNYRRLYIYNRKLMVVYSYYN